MPDANPIYDPGHEFTGRATGAAVVGARFVAVAAAKTDGNPTPIKHCGAADSAIGVSLCGIPQDDVGGVLKTGTVQVTAGDDVTFGQPLEVMAGGKVVTQDEGAKVAVALGTAAADELVLVQIQL